MSLLNKYRELEREISRQLNQLDALKANKELEKDLEFEGKLRELMTEYGISSYGVLAILGVQQNDAKASNTVRKPREEKVYIHPDTQEVVRTKGGNHKVLKAWKAEYGDEMVEAWLS